MIISNEAIITERHGFIPQTVLSEKNARRKAIMKRTLKRLFCGFLVMLMCVGMLPINALAWSYMSHANSANIIRTKMLSTYTKDDKKTIDVYTLVMDEIANTLPYKIPEEFFRAIREYPEAFRAGSLGPDFYPDMLIGQMYIHPYDEDADVGSGDWLKLLIDSVNRMPQYSEGRLEALSFTLGYMLHYCGDLFGHDFVNTFSGGTFASFAEINVPDNINELSTLNDPELNNILSHMAVESTMDSYVNSDFYYNNELQTIAAPTKFVTDSMVLNGNMSSGVADFYYKFEAIDLEKTLENVEGIGDIANTFLGGVPIYLDIIVNFRECIMAVADKFRPNTELITMGISSYADQWAQDIDRALYGLTETFDMIAHRLVTGETNPKVEHDSIHDWIMEGYPLKEILKDFLDIDELLSSAEEEGKMGAVEVILEELGLWWDTYALKALGVPDVFVDGLPEWLDYITQIFTWPMDIVMAAVKTAFAAIFAGILIEVFDAEITIVLNTVASTKDRIEDAMVQLDHPDNPYRPSENNFAELASYLIEYKEEQKLLDSETLYTFLMNENRTLDALVDSDFEAFYNTMAMFKLILMGPDNFSAYFRSQTDAEQTAYSTNTAVLEATVLRLAVKTIDMPYSGTDDNVWALVYHRENAGRLSSEPIAKKLLDNSLNNDLECGDTNVFDIDLPRPTPLDEIEIIFKQEGTATVNGGWACESVTVYPMHAGVMLCPEGIGVGGNLNMDAGVVWQLEFNKALQYYRDGSIDGTWPVTHIKVTVGTGNNDLTSGTDKDVILRAYNNDGYSVDVVLDKYLVNDFEPILSDVYMVPIGEFSALTKKNSYSSLEDLKLELSTYTSNDWYVRFVEVQPYCGEIKLCDSWFIAYNKWLLESSDYIDLTPDQDDVVYYSRIPLKLSYDTALDDGLLEGIRSIDAGVQWTEMSVFWDTEAGREFFFNYFKGFAPEIELTVAEKYIGSKDPIKLTLDFDGKWNGVGEKRRNALAEYSTEVLKQDTYAPLPAVEGTYKIEVINSDGTVVATKTNDITKRGSVLDSTVLDSTNQEALNITMYQWVNASNWPVGTYDIRVTYNPGEVVSGSVYAEKPEQNYSCAQETFEDVFIVSADRAGVLLSTEVNNVHYGYARGGGWFEKGSEVTLTAEPVEGYRFVRWEALGNEITTEPTYTFNITTDWTFTAVFEPITYRISAETDGSGTVEGIGVYEHGDKGTLTAVPNRGYVFDGWYLNSQFENRISTKESHDFTADRNATMYAKFVLGAKVTVNGDEESGFAVYVDSDESVKLEYLLNGGKLTLEDLRGRQKDMVGQSFDVILNSDVAFTVEIKDGYEKTDEFKVVAQYTDHSGRKPILVNTKLYPDVNGKYTFTAKAPTEILVSGVQKIKPTPAPILDYEESNGSIVFTVSMPKTEEVAALTGTMFLYVNGRVAASTDFNGKISYTLTADTIAKNDGVFSVSATAQAEGKPISETVTLTGSGNDVVVPVEIENTENGTVSVDQKYDAPDAVTEFSVTPEIGYALTEVTVIKADDDTELEIGELDGKLTFIRPSAGVTIKAVFSPADVNGDKELTDEDAELMNKYFAGHAESELDKENFDSSGADMDGDRKITRKDAMILARIAAGWTTNIGE